jgi:predicted TIM-barrel fold metal-dependent hydrolase
MSDVFDIHAHIGARDGRAFGADRLLASMDRAGVRHALVSPMDDSLHQSVAEGNDLVIEAVHRHPDRLTGFAYTDPTVTHGAVEELDRALRAGLHGLKLKPRAEGFAASARILRRVVERAAEAGVPVFVHSGSIMSPFMDKICLLAGQFPDTPFIVSFCRSFGNWHGAADCGERHPNVTFDTADLPAAELARLLARLGPRRLLFGSGMPFGSLRFELAKVRSVLRDAPELPDVLHGNARTLLACPEPVAGPVT